MDDKKMDTKQMDDSTLLVLKLVVRTGLADPTNSYGGIMVLSKSITQELSVIYKDKYSCFKCKEEKKVSENGKICFSFPMFVCFSIAGGTKDILCSEHRSDEFVQMPCCDAYVHTNLWLHYCGSRVNGLTICCNRRICYVCRKIHTREDIRCLLCSFHIGHVRCDSCNRYAMFHCIRCKSFVCNKHPSKEPKNLSRRDRIRKHICCPTCKSTNVIQKGYKTIQTS